MPSHASPPSRPIGSDRGTGKRRHPPTPGGGNGMSSVTAPALSRWTLRHAWHGPAERHALDLCRTALRDLGIDLADANATNTPSAIKAHAMEMVDLQALDPSALLDLRAVAHAAQWPRRLPAFVQKPMVHAERWHGIPLGIHRANCAWVNAACARRIGLGVPPDMPGFATWLELAAERTPKPLAVGAQAWQVGVLFESVMLAMSGGTAYRRAFVEHDATIWGETCITEALNGLQRLREFVDDDALPYSWEQQLERVRQGDAAVQVMGDWVRATDCGSLLEWAVPGTAAWFVAIVDYVVPLAGAPSILTNHAAAALTAAPFQYAFAMAKGCLPAVQDAWGVIDPQRKRGVDVEAMVLPSLTFDQCGSVGHKEALLAIVADCFVQCRSVTACALALQELAHHQAPTHRKE